MEKQTIILRITATIDFGQEAINWMDEITNGRSDNELSNLWIIKDHGQYFLNEFRGQFGEILIEEIDSEVQAYFKERGMSEEYLPKAEVVETFAGSLTIATIVAIGYAVGKTYEVIKGVSEIPETVGGLTKLKNSIVNKFRRRSNAKAKEILDDQAKRQNLPAPPQNIIDVKNFVIDARPLSALRPSEMKSHSIHLTAGVSQESFTLENLGTEEMRDLQIGLFVGEDKRNQWSFADAYIGSVSLLSPKQTISKTLEEFSHMTHGKLVIKDIPAHVDCWIQDLYGIYLFNFYLDK